EDFAFAGGKGRCTWKGTARDAPRFWTIETVTPVSSMTISYRFSPAACGTRFERDMDYTVNRAWLRLFDGLLIRPHIASESRRALDGLKAVLEDADRAGVHLPKPVRA